MTTEIKPEETVETPTPKKKRIPKKAWGYIATGVACALIGASVGTTKTVEVEKPVEVVKEIEVPTVPEVCQNFSNAADNLNDLNAEGFGIVADIMDAVSRLDMAGMSAATTRLNDLRVNERDPAQLVYLALQNECLNS